MPQLFVSGSTGIDTDTCGESTSTPCATIKKALSHIGEGGIIRIAQGNYTEADMRVGGNQNVTFEGGWNTDFSHQTCTPAATTIITGNTGRDILFWITNHGSGEQTRLTLKCLTLKQPSSGEIKRAVVVSAYSGAKAWVTIDHVRITGFGEPVLSENSANNGAITTNLQKVTFDQNPGGGNTVIAERTDNGWITMKTSDVRIINNGTAGKSQRPLDIRSKGNGSVEVALQNTIIAGNRTGNDPIIGIRANDTSSIALHSTSNSSAANNGNNTITDNSIEALTSGLVAESHDSAQILINMHNTILYGNTYPGLIYEMKLEKSSGAAFSFTADHCVLDTPDIIGDVHYTSTHQINGGLQLDSSYHQKKGSETIDAGLCGEWDQFFSYKRIAPYVDIDGDKRPGFGKTLGCDIGADEYKPFPWPMFLPAIVRPHLNPYTIPTTPRF